MTKFATPSAVRNFALTVLLIAAAALSVATASRGGLQYVTQFDGGAGGRLAVTSYTTFDAVARSAPRADVRFVLLSVNLAAQQATAGSRLGQYLAP